MAKPVIAYWDIRGLAEPIRLMLEYLSVDYEDKRYACGDGPAYDRSSWLNEKPTLGLSFPNLPYYVDECGKMTESFAIMKHIARKNKGLQPTTDEERRRTDMLEGVIADFRGAFIALCYRPGYEENKRQFLEVTLPSKLALFNSYFEGKKWLSGDTLTYADFALGEILDHVRTMSPGCIDKFKNISDFLERFFSLEKISAYRNSKRFKKFPVNNKMAHWGGKAEA